MDSKESPEQSQTEPVKYQERDNLILKKRNSACFESELPFHVFGNPSIHGQSSEESQAPSPDEQEIGNSSALSSFASRRRHTHSEATNLALLTENTNITSVQVSDNSNSNKRRASLVKNGNAVAVNNTNMSHGMGINFGLEINNGDTSLAGKAANFPVRRSSSVCVTQEGGDGVWNTGARQGSLSYGPGSLNGNSPIHLQQLKYSRGQRQHRRSALFLSQTQREESWFGVNEPSLAQPTNFLTAGRPNVNFKMDIGLAADNRNEINNLHVTLPLFKEQGNGSRSIGNDESLWKARDKRFESEETDNTPYEQKRGSVEFDEDIEINPDVEDDNEDESDTNEGDEPENEDWVKKGVSSKEEDELLFSCKEMADQKNWTAVAEKIPFRSAKQCRERWCYNLNPKIKKAGWTYAEDIVLIRNQKRMGNKWAQIAMLLEGRTENAVKTRFKSLQRAMKREWRPDEDRMIIRLHNEKYGPGWKKISEEMSKHRTKHAVKIRFRQLQAGILDEDLPEKGSAKATVRELYYPERTKAQISAEYRLLCNRDYNKFVSIKQQLGQQNSDLTNLAALFKQRATTDKADELSHMSVTQDDAYKTQGSDVDISKVFENDELLRRQFNNGQETSVSDNRLYGGQYSAFEPSSFTFGNLPLLHGDRHPSTFPNQNYDNINLRLPEPNLFEPGAYGFNFHRQPNLSNQDIEPLTVNSSGYFNNNPPRSFFGSGVVLRSNQETIGQSNNYNNDYNTAMKNRNCNFVGGVVIKNEFANIIGSGFSNDHSKDKEYEDNFNDIFEVCSEEDSLIYA